MAKYEVTFPIKGTFTTTVVADSVEEAAEVAAEIIADDDDEDADGELEWSAVLDKADSVRKVQ